MGGFGEPSPITAAMPVSAAGTGVGPVTSSRWAMTRSWLTAATDMFHGAVFATVLGPGPLLPAEAATKMPAEYASRNAWSTRSFQGSSRPEIE